MTMQTTYPLFTALPLAAAFFNLLVTKLNKKAADYIALFATAALAVMAVLTVFEQPFAYRVGGFPAPWGILLISDGLSSLMLVIINVIAFLSIIYSMKYMTMYEIKTGGKNTVSKAYEQANKTFNALRYKPNLKINFVLISDMYGVRRIKDVNF